MPIRPKRELSFIILDSIVLTIHIYSNTEESFHVTSAKSQVI